MQHARNPVAHQFCHHDNRSSNNDSNVLAPLAVPHDLRPSRYLCVMGRRVPAMTAAAAAAAMALVTLTTAALQPAMMVLVSVVLVVLVVLVLVLVLVLVSVVVVVVVVSTTARTWMRMSSRNMKPQRIASLA